MTEREFTIGSDRFQLYKIDAFKQFHIVRRLGPILKDIIPIAKQAKNVNLEGMSEDQKLDHFSKLIGPIMEGISKLSDADANLVLLGLCGSVQIHQSKFNNWAWVATGDTLSFTLSLPVLLQIAARAFAFNLADFFATAHQVTHGQA